MMLLGCGTDIVFNSRFQGKSDEFLSKLLNECELKKINECVSTSKRVETIGSLFALKEAVSKALGFSLFDVGIKNITVENDKKGKPLVSLNSTLLNQIKAYYKISTVNILSSISHEKDYSVAFAVFEGEA